MTTSAVMSRETGRPAQTSQLRRRWHHPSVRRNLIGWEWACPCGAANYRRYDEGTWRTAFAQALGHALHCTG